MMGTSANAPRSISMASVNSEGSTETASEQPEFGTLTQNVVSFKHSLAKFRKALDLGQSSEELDDTMQVAVHDRTKEVLTILKCMFEKYPALRSQELIAAAGNFVREAKAFEGEPKDPKDILICIDQLALAFSSRVSEYLMGDIDSNISLSSSMSSKTKSCENLAPDAEPGVMTAIVHGLADDRKAEEETAACLEVDGLLMRLEQGVDFALQHAKLWSKYAKDLMMYVEKRAHLEIEFNKNLKKLAMTVRPLINEECHLPFQSTYCSALDHDMDISSSCLQTYELLGERFLEPLNTQRAEHERTRKYLKETWYKELAKMQKVFSNLQRVHHSYIKTQQDWDQFHEDCLEQSMQGGKYERKKALEEEAMQKAVEAEVAYKTAISQANDSHAQMLKVKADILKSIREQMKKSDKVLQAVTVDYFQIEQALTKALPVQFRSFSESSQLYEPGSQYMEFVKRLSIPLVSPMQEPFSFEPYSKTAHKLLELERKSTDSVKCDDVYRVKGTCNMKVMQGASFGSDTDSIASSQSNKSHEPSPTRKVIGMSSGDELSGNDNELQPPSTFSMSKAAATHNFTEIKKSRRSKSRCIQCDSMVLIEGGECSECKVKCHWKCLDHMIIMCEAKVPPVEQAANLDVPLALTKCIEAIEAHGKFEKGIYRISGVTSTVKKVITQLKEHPNLVDLSETLPRVVSDVLKLFLREYPEPILPFSMYDDFIRVATNSMNNEMEALEEMKILVHKVPKHLFCILKTIMQHLERVGREEAFNSMPASNLGIVFGPNLFRVGTHPKVKTNDTTKQNQAVYIMIKYANYIFGSPDGQIETEREESQKQQVQEVTSDEEQSYLLLPDDLAGSSGLSLETSHRVFEGSLKDYQGLEGLTLPSQRVTLSESTQRMEATVTKITRGKKLLNNQRTESSADSDYSFESHASSSLESRSPRELEENCDMILELPSWLRSPATAPVVAGNSPSSSMSQSPEECENAAASQPSSLEQASVTGGVANSSALYTILRRQYRTETRHQEERWFNN